MLLIMQMQSINISLFIFFMRATKVFCKQLLLFIRSRISEIPCLGKAVMLVILSFLSVSTCISIAFVPYMIIRIFFFLLHWQLKNLCLVANKPTRDFSTFYCKIIERIFNFMSRIFFPPFQCRSISNSMHRSQCLSNFEI